MLTGYRHCVPYSRFACSAYALTSRSDSLGTSASSDIVMIWPHVQLHPVVEPHVSHLRHVPFLRSVKLPHSPQASPS